ncbi:hypothetical protein SISSUDRAFT_517348 [Sistotremastrum suecicum HHB10207 ss-3]|uniref:Uncharacterized protein n=1 Tax=Sistotremastrum suecicum HHB10207 ss-3 TaxID=1314776 RepID=A0A166F8X0_9AGAM|nr:hypothetical protein SISSUDRAFT_517348 [Sistotremastrum suecicum HHB10207 ss-3]
MPPATEESLPPYHEAEVSANIVTSSNEGVRLEYNPRAHSHGPSPHGSSTDLRPTASSSSQGESYGSSLICGSGVCIPPTPEQKSTFDAQSIARLNVVAEYWPTPDKSLLRTFDAKSIYKSATSQLDVLLPLLQRDTSSSATSSLTTPASNRVITLHLPSFPQPSPMGRASFMKNPQDRNLRNFDELAKYFHGVIWQTPYTREQNIMRLLDLMECILTRIALEGFFVSQWNHVLLPFTS